MYFTELAQRLGGPPVTKKCKLGVATAIDCRAEVNCK